jgi:hypothetical protein
MPRSGSLQQRIGTIRASGTLTKLRDISFFFIPQSDFVSPQQKSNHGPSTQRLGMFNANPTQWSGKSGLGFS